MITISIIILGLVNVLFPKQLWYIYRFKIDMSNKDGAKISSTRPTKFFEYISRVIGLSLIAVGVFTQILN